MAPHYEYKESCNCWYCRHLRILKKYKDGMILDDQDRNIIDDLALIGLMHIGISLKHKHLTAKTTELGIKIMSDLK